MQQIQCQCQAKMKWAAYSTYRSENAGRVFPSGFAQHQRFPIIIQKDYNRCHTFDNDSCIMFMFSHTGTSRGYNRTDKYRGVRYFLRSTSAVRLLPSRLHFKPAAVNSSNRTWLKITCSQLLLATAQWDHEDSSVRAM